jgi:hypothetical protein
VVAMGLAVGMIMVLDSANRIDHPSLTSRVTCHLDQSLPWESPRPFLGLASSYLVSKSPLSLMVGLRVAAPKLGVRILNTFRNLLASGRLHQYCLSLPIASSSIYFSTVISLLRCFWDGNV